MSRVANTTNIIMAVVAVTTLLITLGIIKPFSDDKNEPDENNGSADTTVEDIRQPADRNDDNRRETGARTAPDRSSSSTGGLPVRPPSEGGLPVRPPSEGGSGSTSGGLPVRPPHLVVQGHYLFARNSSDCVNARAGVARMEQYLDDQSPIPADDSLYRTVRYPERVSDPLVSDLARDRIHRIKNSVSHRDCFN